MEFQDDIFLFYFYLLSHKAMCSFINLISVSINLGNNLIWATPLRPCVDCGRLLTNHAYTIITRFELQF